MTYQNRQKIVHAKKKFIDENVVSSKTLFNLKIFKNWQIKIENHFVDENSYCFSLNLTNFKFLSFMCAEWYDFDDD